jgi:hypothetical protein
MAKEKKNQEGGFGPWGGWTTPKGQKKKIEEGVLALGVGSATPGRPIWG